MNLRDEEIAAIEAPFLLAEDQYGYRPEVAMHRAIANAAYDRGKGDGMWAVVDWLKRDAQSELKHYSVGRDLEDWLQSQGIERTGD